MTQKSTVITHERPLSPHLSIYRWQITMVLSILHRITGLALAIGTALLVLWLWATAYDANAFACIHRFLTSIIGQVLLFGWSYAFFFHFCNGIRHLFWDVGKGFEIHTAARTGWAVVMVSILATLVLWAIILIPMGGS